MDAFESLIRLLLDRNEYWTRQSHKVNLTKEEKKAIGKPSIPRPEIDLIAFQPLRNEVIALEVKSYLDSLGVQLKEIKQKFQIPAGRYKLFTCDNYRKIVFHRLSHELSEAGLINNSTTIKLGLAAGKVYKNEEAELGAHLTKNGHFFIGPSKIKRDVKLLARSNYENDPFIITAKVALR
jgi:hypothetical protein